jgi:predicted lipid-binding transport protein (Tim44 family)
MPVDILILAGIAVFVVLRLRGVLGQDIGHRPSADNTFQKKNEKSEEERVIKLDTIRGGAHQTETLSDTQKTAIKEAVLDLSDVPDALKEDVKKLHVVDKQFIVQDFLEGAAAAFEIILSAYGKHDRAAFKPLLSKDLYEQFCADIDEQRKRDERNESTLLAITDMQLHAVELVKHMARVTVLISSEQVHVTRNVRNEIIAGNGSDVDKVQDHWTFERDTRSSNPNWTLIAT